MKILLVFPFYPPDKGVSTFRAMSFYNSLSKDYDVRVLKPGTTDDLRPAQTVNTLDSRYIKAIAMSVFFRNRLSNLLKDYLKQFDCIIVSVPMFSLCMIAIIARKIGIPAIIDIRDHPNLVYYEKIQGKNKIYKLIRWLIWKCTEALLTAAVSRSNAVMCVGLRSCEYQIKKTPFHKAKIYNVHNGFEENDWKFVEGLRRSIVSQNQSTISIGIAGSIHRFRDTVSLRNVLHRLDEIASSIPLHIEHWGTLSQELSEYVTTLKSISYIKHEMIARQEYLSQIIQCNLVLLACSESLIWEPTTTVFDYILLGKPIIFVGNKGNEAFRILKECGAKTLNQDELSKDNIFYSAKLFWEPKGELILRYSRENQNEQMMNIVIKTSIPSGS